jgi:hypothetical protein
MRDPATCFDPEVEAAIEETSRFLQSYVQDDAWKGASNITGPAADMDAAVYEIERSALPDWAKNLVVWACLHQKKKSAGAGRRRTIATRRSSGPPFGSWIGMATSQLAMRRRVIESRRPASYVSHFTGSA